MSHLVRPHPQDHNRASSCGFDVSVSDDGSVVCGSDVSGINVSSLCCPFV